MVDTVRNTSALATLFADNTTGEISPQDLRDFLQSANVGFEVDSREFIAVSAATDVSSDLKLALEAARDRGVPLNMFPMKYLVNTAIDISLDDGQKLEWNFTPGAQINSTDSTVNNGRITFSSDPVLQMALSTQINFGDKQIEVADGSAILQGDFVRVRAEIAYSNDSQNIAYMYGTVTYVDTASSPNIIFLDNKSFYVIKPNREIEYRWDGVTNSFTYRWFFGTPSLVQVIVNDVTAAISTGVATGAGIEFTFTSAAPASAPAVSASVRATSTGENDMVEIYRSGDLKINGFNYSANWSDISGTTGKTVLRFEGIQSPHLVNPRWVIVRPTETASPPFGGPEFIQGFCSKLLMENPYIEGGGYSLRCAGYDHVYKNLTAFHCYKAIDQQGDNHGTTVFGMTLDGVFQVVADHGSKNGRYYNIRGTNIGKPWQNRGTGLLIENAHIVYASAGENDEGSSFKFLTADTLAVTADDPRESYEEPNNFEALDSYTILRNIKTSGPVFRATCGGNYLYRVENFDGNVHFQYDGGGPPETTRVEHFNVNTRGSPVQFKAAQSGLIINGQYGNVSAVQVGLSSFSRFHARDNTFALAAAKARTSAKDYGLGEQFFQDDSDSVSRAYWIETAGSSSNTDPNTALGLDPEVSYTDGTAIVRYLGVRTTP